MRLKKAKNIIEAYEVFETQHPLEAKDKDFYVDIYQKDITNLRKALIFNSIPDKTFFVTGQSGNGKSTALNFLPQKNINDKYFLKYLKGRDAFKMDDIDIIDIILMIGFSIVHKDNNLEKEFLKELQVLKNIKLKRIKKEVQNEIKNQNEIGGGAFVKGKISLFSMINFNSDFFAKFKIEKSSRETVRELFSLDKLELVEKINKIIQKAKEITNKNILLIIDDLEKIRKKDQSENIFLDNIEVINKINCLKIVTFPVYLATDHAMYQDAYKFSTRITKNPFTNENKDHLCINNFKKLKDVVYTRLDNKSLVDEEACELAVKYSGGNLRSLIKLMQNAAKNAVDIDDMDSFTTIAIPDVEASVEESCNLSSLSVMKRIKVLNYVLKNHKEPPEDYEMRDAFIQSVLDNSVFAYFNGYPWYEVNPIIRESIEIYSKEKE